jgi:hypothetical protein
MALAGRAGPGSREPWIPEPGGGLLAGLISPGFAGRVTMTVPAAALLDLAGRAGELADIGPVDPDPGANVSDRYQAGTSAEAICAAFRGRAAG